MTSYTIFICLSVFALIGFLLTRQKILVSVDGEIARLHSLPRHYGYYAATWTLLPGLLVFILWLAFGSLILDELILSYVSPSLKLDYKEEISLLLNRIRLVVSNISRFEQNPDILAAAKAYKSLHSSALWVTFILCLSASSIGFLLAFRRTVKEFRARDRFEKVWTYALAASSAVAVLTTAGIIASLLFESLRFFSDVSVLDFVFGLDWSPQTAIREDQIVAEGKFGAVPLFVGTLLITVVAMFIAGPIGLLAAVYLTQYADKTTRNIAKPLLEILAGVPTVVYGFFAAITIAPLFQNWGDALGLDIASESALVAGFVMGIMIIPFVSSLSDDAITAVPHSIKNGSTALGATRFETIVRVIIPAALPGIMGAFLLAISRAIGETMIVVMAAGLQPRLTANPFESVTTVTAQIVTLLTGDQEFDSTKTLSAFALGLALFLTTLFFNGFAAKIVSRYRNAYE